MSKALDRRLGLWPVLAISLSTMLGSGIFVLPGIAYSKTGPSLWLAYVLAGMCALPAAFSKAELATAMPTSGGTYVYLERTYGPLAGTIAGLGLWASLLLKSSFALVGFAAYLYVLAAVPIVPTALTLLVLIVLLNVRGVALVGRIQLAVVVASLLGLVGLLAAGAIQFDPTRLSGHFSGGGAGLLSAAALVFVSYAGVTKVAAIAEEVRDPARTLPRGMLISLVIAGVLYTGISLVLVGNVPGEDLSGSLRPVHELGLHLGGPTLGVLVALLAVVTMTAMANGGLLAASRFPFAMSRDSLLPKGLAHIHERWLTPVGCIVLTGGVMAAVILLLDVEKIAKLASSFAIMIFVAVHTSVLVLRESRTQWYRPDYHSPLYPAMQIFGILSGLALLVAMGWLGLAVAAALVLAGTLLFAVYGRTRVRRQGVFARMGPRQDLLDRHRSTDMDDELVAEAAVAVALFGQERSPEMLVEMAAVLADGRPLEVLHLTEVPEQTHLDALGENDAIVAGLERRLGAMSEERGLDLHFNALASRDVARTVRTASERLRTDCIVIEWRRRYESRRVVRNPRGWLLDHLDCNLATFRDAGVRFVREILVYAEPGPHDALVVSTAEHLAAQYGARLTIATFAADGVSESAVSEAEGYLSRLRELCERPTQQRLLRGAAKVPSVSEVTAELDLLVLGSSAGSSFWSYLFGTETDKIIGAAACSVLALKTPPTRTHDAAVAERADERRSTDLLGYLEPAVCQAGASATRKEGLFTEFAERLAGHLPDLTPKDVVDALWEREQTQNTALGEGLAIPHATLTGLDRSYVGLTTLEQSIDYRASDGQLVDIVFFFVGPMSDRQIHLGLLAHVAKLVQRTPLLEWLRAAPDRSAMVAALQRAVREATEEHEDPDDDEVAA